MFACVRVLVRACAGGRAQAFYMLGPWTGSNNMILDSQRPS